ncbi:MAG TPA: porin [Burkholderiaceae bacterium]|nr:porin [Burkholderiaceae bacterium]
MKKSLIALAALAFVGAASAQSSVTLYGVADVAVAKAKGAKLGAAPNANQTSRWGLKGSEDLGGGLKATFTFEQAVSLADGSTSKGFARQANVGFEGGFGTVKIGQNWNPLDDIYYNGDSMFGANALSLQNGVWGNSYTGAAAAQLYYATPEIAGFSGAYSTQLKGNAAKKVSSFHVKYASGPVYAGLGYENDETMGRKGTMLNATYDLGMAKLLGSYYTTKKFGTTPKIDSYQFGADIPMGAALTLTVGYASSKAKVAGAKAGTGFGVGAAYALSKRTTVYGGIRATNAAAGDNDIWGLGINHKF